MVHISFIAKVQCFKLYPVKSGCKRHGYELCNGSSHTNHMHRIRTILVLPIIVTDFNLNQSPSNLNQYSKIDREAHWIQLTLDPMAGRQTPLRMSIHPFLISLSSMHIFVVICWRCSLVFCSAHCCPSDLIQC